MWSTGDNRNKIWRRITTSWVLFIFVKKQYKTKVFDVKSITIKFDKRRDNDHGNNIEEEDGIEESAVWSDII